MRLLFSSMIFLLLSSLPVDAVNPDEILSDPVLEGRAREISKGLRCLVCQNQSIDDSDASLAKDLRVLVRERLTAGDSNDQVVTYVVSRYGDFVLLKPPFNISTLVLWVGPFLMIGFGLLAIILFFRKNRTTSATAPRVVPLSETEKKQLADLLEEDNQ